MHSIEEMGTNVPAFLAKLWKIVEDPETNDLICWSPGGSSFFIRNQARFSRELLPLYYKHNNMASFVRQLNMYGFHKVVSIEGGGLKVDKDEMEFAHQCFLMGHPYLLEHIKRKIPTSKVEEGRTCTKPEMMNKVLLDVKSMKGRQDSLDSQLCSMKRENEVLWREVAILRQKHLKQQQIVNKLIQFLMTMVQSSRNGGIGIKRHYPLMLNDTSHRPSKISKLSAELSDLNSASNIVSPTGPVIHELDAAELLEDCEANPEDSDAEESFLPSDLCSVVINGDAESKNLVPSSKPNEPGSPDPITGNPNTEVLLELAEECPLSPSLLLTTLPIEISPINVIPKVSKGKGRARVTTTENKKRRLKRINSNTITTGTASATPKASSPTAEEEPLVNGVELLDVVLPKLAKAGALNLLETNNEEASDTQGTGDLLTPRSLAAATDATVSAICSVAAASKKKSKSADSSGPKSFSKSSLNGILPVSTVTSSKYASTNLADSAVSDSDTNKNVKLYTNDLMVFKQEPMVFKQEPSTSSAKSGSPSNMILAYTGNNSEDSFNRMGASSSLEDEKALVDLRGELDSHVDSLQNDLDSIREYLKGDGYSLDANTLLGIFGDDPLSATFENLPEEQEKQSTSGSELATYSTNLLDMVDMFGGSGAGEWRSPSTPESSNIMDVSLSELNTPQMAVVSPSAVFKKIK